MKKEHLAGDQNKLNRRDYIQAFEKNKQFIEMLQDNLHKKIDSIERLMDNSSSNKNIIMALDELKDMIDINDMTFYTGNVILDSVLREKVKICLYHNIILDAIVNFSEINFINDEHIYKIFSDLLDVAITKGKQIDSFNKKIIVRGTIKNGYIVVQIGYMNLLDSKKDDISDVESIVNRYNGNIIFKMKDNMKIITISIPVPEKVMEDYKQKVLIEDDGLTHR